jgi:hypothetical protein
MVPPNLRPKLPWRLRNIALRTRARQSPAGIPAGSQRGFFSVVVWAPVLLMFAAVSYFLFRLAEYLLLRA